MLIVIAILATLSTIAIPAYSNYIQRAKIARCIAEVRMLEPEIAAYRENNDKLPDNLNDLGRGNILDPWGNPYQFLNFVNVKGVGEMRKDRNLVPINAHFDLYSMGKDGKSQPPLTAKASHDDIIRANNGSFIGIASDY
jgi:general secretion pathway protein G